MQLLDVLFLNHCQAFTVLAPQKLLLGATLRGRFFRLLGDVLLRTTKGGSACTLTQAQVKPRVEGIWVPKHTPAQRCGGRYDACRGPVFYGSSRHVQDLRDVLFGQR